MENVNITLEDLNEYKNEVLENKQKIETARVGGLEKIEQQCVEYRQKLVSEFEQEVEKDMQKCDTEIELLDKLINKQKIKQEEIL